MKFVSCSIDSRTFAGLVDGDRVHPLVQADDVGEALQHGLVDELHPEAGSGYALKDVRFLPVIPAPEKIICLGLNYRSHVEETGRERPTYPVLFAKFASTLIGEGNDIVKPSESRQVDFEAELAVVIGRSVRRAAPEEALSTVAGYTIANDITMRDYQYKSHQWLQGKAWDASTPLGPMLVTPDEIDDVGALGISLRVNGETMQSSNTSRLIFGVAEIIRHVSQFTELHPGDVLLTGTPGGVGYRRDPQVFLEPGDVVEAEIEGLGILRNRVVAES